MNRFLHFIKQLIPTRVFAALQPTYHQLFSWLAAAWYRHPSDKLVVIGVTGTTGKSTTIHLIAKTLEHAGYTVGYTSTALFKIGEKEWNNDKKMTMPGRFFTQRMLKKMVDAGCHYAIIETTSQGIAQFRHRHINYDIALITGLYPEHIEAHGGFENYRRAKGKLFEHLMRCAPKYLGANRRVQQVARGLGQINAERVRKTAIINADFEYAPYYAGFKAEEKILYHVAQAKQYVTPADANAVQVEAHGVTQTPAGVYCVIDDTPLQLQLMGRFNVYNALAAYSVGRALAIEAAALRTGLEGITGVPGRFERIDEGQDFTVIVDYAFEPEAVKKLYETVNRMEANRIIHVLGSTGGGRDVSRRAVLGRIAGEHADIVIVTNEDPYDDDPEIIIDQVAVGAEKAGKELDGTLFKIIDRRAAIATALARAEQGDIVLITGKGNEQGICVEGGKIIPWDDRTVAREELQKLLR